MDSFKKITVGFVVQEYRKDESGGYICVSQEFIAGDQVDFEDSCGNSIAVPGHKYQSFNMTIADMAEIADSIEAVLSGLDIGGEQSRQFAVEIDLLKAVLKALAVTEGKDSMGLVESQLLGACKTLVSYVSEMIYQMNDQADLSEIEEIQQAKYLIERYYSN